IEIPPLRQRPDDIPVLVTAFLGEFNQAAGHVVELTAPTMDALLRHDGPGNVRELRNVIERATIVWEEGACRPDNLSLHSISPATADSSELEVLERRTIEHVMRETNGNKVKASQRLGISRTQLYSRLRKYGFEAGPADGSAQAVSAC